MWLCIFLVSLQSSVSNYKPAAEVTSFNNYFDLILSTMLVLDLQFQNSNMISNMIIKYIFLFSSHECNFYKK